MGRRNIDVPTTGCIYNEDKMKPIVISALNLRRSRIPKRRVSMARSKAYGCGSRLALSYQEDQRTEYIKLTTCSTLEDSKTCGLNSVENGADHK